MKYKLIWIEGHYWGNWPQEYIDQANIVSQDSDGFDEERTIGIEAPDDQSAYEIAIKLVEGEPQAEVWSLVQAGEDGKRVATEEGLEQ